MSSFYVFILGGDSNNHVVDLNFIMGLDNLNKKLFITVTASKIYRRYFKTK